ILTAVALLMRRAAKNVQHTITIPGEKISDAELGNLKDVSHAGSLHEYLMRLHKKYGPIASFYWGKQYVVSLASIESWHATMRLFDRPVLLFSLFMPIIGENSIQYTNGPIGKQRRKDYYDAALSKASVRNSYWVFEHVLREKLKQWNNERYGTQQKPLPVHQEMISLAISSISLQAFGLLLLSDSQNNIQHAYQICWNDIEERIKGSFPEQGSEREKEFNKSLDYLHSKVDEMINKKRNGDNELTNSCFLDYLMNSGNITEEQIRSEVITMLVGGFHTTGNLLTWTLYYLAKHSDIQERVYRELIDVLGLEIPYPSFEQVDQLPYLSCVINESLRLPVLAPWAARISSNDELVCGYTIPANTPMIQALGVVLSDEKIWNKPNEFNPDRFLNRKSTLAFSPFGFA
ncbi:unnamed protein product, partial [Didymodactylos carnosus]